jgi:hypothetical protein
MNQTAVYLIPNHRKHGLRSRLSESASPVLSSGTPPRGLGPRDGLDVDFLALLTRGAAGLFGGDIVRTGSWYENAKNRLSIKFPTRAPTMHEDFRGSKNQD